MSSQLFNISSKSGHDYSRFYAISLNTLSPQAIAARKVSAINFIVTLASRQEFQTRKPRSAPASKDPVKRESPTPEPFLLPREFPVVCKKTYCIFCIGNKRLLYGDRTRAFIRVSHMIDHVEYLHLRYLPPGEWVICHHPVCKAEGVVLNNVIHFKNHMATIHKINLRP